MNDPKKDIINLTRIGTNGGGSQTACSFLHELSEQRNPGDYCVVAFNNTPASKVAQERGFCPVLVERNLRERAYWDLACRKVFARGQLCFTFHGVPWLASKGYLVNVSGAADSNLYYPDVRFWKHCSISVQAVKYLKDRGRMFGYSRADYWIFETHTLAGRAVALGGYPEERVAVVKMSASAFVSRARIDPTVRDRFKEQIGSGFACLFMAGANPNKRIGSIAPAIAAIGSRRLTNGPVKAVTTLDPRSGYYHTLQQEFRRCGVDGAWVNLGPVAHDQISSLVDACDVVCLFSVLESFSSNFTEAWAMRKPLLVTDADWAKSACGNAAMYVSPTDSLQVADAIVRLMSPAVQAELLQHYDSHFRTYPTAQQRCKQYLECMEKARLLGSMRSEDRKTVRRFMSCRRSGCSDRRKVPLT